MEARQISLHHLGSKAERVKSCRSQFKLDPDQPVSQSAEFETALPAQRLTGDGTSLDWRDATPKALRHEASLTLLKYPTPIFLVRFHRPVRYKHSPSVFFQP